MQRWLADIPALAQYARPWTAGCLKSLTLMPVKMGWTGRTDGATLEIGLAYIHSRNIPMPLTQAPMSTHACAYFGSRERLIRLT